MNRKRIERIWREDELFERHGMPAVMRSDDGGEFIAAEVMDWLEETSAETFHMEPGKPRQNSYASRLTAGCAMPQSTLTADGS